MNSPTLHDRVCGCIVAGAVGDAMGGAFEGRDGPIDLQEILSRGDLPPAISDDTQLTLATCESIANTGEISQEAIAANFTRWFRERRISGIGASTLKSLRDLDAGQHWALAGAKGERAAGNGAAMRVAPLAFLLDPAESQHRRILRDISRITHHNEEAYIGALAVVLAVRALAVDSIDPTELLAYVTRHLPDSRVRDRMSEIMHLPGSPTILAVAERYGSSGYVVDSVPLALFACEWIAELPVRELLGRVIQPGGDTDTIASIAGQIAGAAVGISNVPTGMLDEIPEVSLLNDVADRFARRVALQSQGPDHR